MSSQPTDKPSSQTRTVNLRTPLKPSMTCETIQVGKAPERIDTKVWWKDDDWEDRIVDGEWWGSFELKRKIFVDRSLSSSVRKASMWEFRTAGFSVLVSILSFAS